MKPCFNWGLKGVQNNSQFPAGRPLTLPHATSVYARGNQPSVGAPNVTQRSFVRPIAKGQVRRSQQEAGVVREVLSV